MLQSRRASWGTSKCCRSLTLLFLTQVCLIGKSRTYPPAREASMDTQRTRYIHGRRGCPASPPGQAPGPPDPEAAASADHPDGRPDSHSALDAEARQTPEAQAEGLWLPGFRPREKAEHVRNCAALPRDFVDQVVLQVANLLLGGKQLNPRSSHSGSLKTWNRGGNRLHPRETGGASGSDWVSLITSLNACGHF